MAAVRHFEFVFFGMLLSCRPWKHNLHPQAEFHLNRIVSG